MQNGKLKNEKEKRRKGKLLRLYELEGLYGLERLDGPERLYRLEGLHFNISIFFTLVYTEPLFNCFASSR